ncbi:hypothetical protein AALP_AA2G067000 [Arabis alpina]|uniref:Uncharacterized protein n=1 Tax=Arabis alpina TaxID=50452 RepID=A0A087HFR0_ARAAL|nr:hypothetical protein AALP_AA2G067000 [Arabis alpina]
MADNIRRAIQDLNLGVDDEPIALPHAVCSAAIRVNQFSLMGRALMPRHQNLRALVNTLPRNWGLSRLISGRMIERRECVQPEDDQAIVNNEAEDGDDNVDMDPVLEQDVAVHQPLQGNPVDNMQEQNDNNVEMSPEEQDYKNEYEAHSMNGEETWDDFEVDLAVVKGPKVAKRRRRFLENLIEEMEEEATRRATMANSSEAALVDNDTEDSIILEIETRRNDDTPFMEYGSFFGTSTLDSSIVPFPRGNLCMSLNTSAVGTDQFDIGHAHKKQRIQVDIVDKLVVVSSSTQPAVGALQKLRDDYSEPGTSSPPWRSQLRGAVGPIPPEVP